MRVAGVLLAAGAGSRFRGATHKLEVPVDAGPTETALWRWSARRAADAGVSPLIVVSGAVELEANPPDGAETRWKVVHHSQWQRGQASSLQVALGDPAVADADAAVIGLADQPGITTAAWQTVAEAPDLTPIVVARYDGRRGPHPVRLRRDVWALLPDTGDAVARSLIAEHPEWVTEVDCVGSPHDIDTVEDLARWRS